MKLTFVPFIIGILFSFNLSAQYTIPEKMEWWYHDRFGMFIHFGSYSQYGHGEWVQFLDSIPKEEYQTTITQKFNPIQFNAAHIARLAKQAGMKYIIITAKHHEGLAMWRTEALSFTDYTGTKIFDIYNYVGVKRDLLMELKLECERQNIKFGLYYSILDWNHPSQEAFAYFSRFHTLDDKPEYVDDMKKQVKELVDRYSPAILWFDGDWCNDTTPVTRTDWWNKADAIDLYNYVISLDSTIIVNERVKRECELGDFMCPEEKIPNAPLPRQWETCQTMNGGWGYTISKEDEYKSVDTLIQELQIIVSRDGNYLLNIGPKGDGSIPRQDIQILTAIGSWMQTYGESIYGAGRSPFTEEPEWGCYTTKPGKLYAHIQTLPKDRRLVIPLENASISSAYELSNPTKQLDIQHTKSDILITLPEELPDNPVVLITFNSM
ncbi:MAG: alpha-L-fucosidase [Bacteroidales bacterium]|jgi:alpha-L-fucosidase|nr:alpha-L-fucosidase [Bacteroidales bacterium]